jgi:aspartate carbamoyltransferase
MSRETTSMSFEEYKVALGTSASRRKLLFQDGRPFHVLLSQQFSRDDLIHLTDTATSIRRLDRHRDGRDFLRGLLRGVRVMNLFAQPSTRTAESFIAAADKLGATTRLVADIRTSSFSKGESVEDSVRTLSSFFDTIVTRHPENDFAIRAAWSLQKSSRPIPVVSAGSGKSQHVTQSLLDIYTLRYSLLDRGGIDGRTVLIVGDIARNRAARSLAYLLTKFDVARIDFVSAKNYLPENGLVQYIEKHGIKVGVDDNLESYLRTRGGEVDAIYMTRLQQEWDTGGGEPTGKPKEFGTEDAFVLKSEFRSLIRNDCVLMHPLPRVNELPESWEDHPGFVVWRQVRNGMWMRAALFAAIHGADQEIRARAMRLGLV